MRARMRSPRCIRFRCSAVYAAGDFFGELGTCVNVLSLPAFLIPLLLAWRGGIACSPLHCCHSFLVFNDQSAGMEN